ncbi:MAG: orotate phosphoribosyltransferase [Candidatus Omnitrophica bacterium]|nr:orotate phosphoribosyltransferase [Candidatus Omnitrophota bacterium]
MSSYKEIKKRLFYLIKKNAFFKKKVKLSSGRISNFYFDLRRITLDPEGGYLIAKLILRFLHKKGVKSLGGPTLGADPIVSAVAVLSHLEGISVKAFIVRRKAKEHGLRQLIEGPSLKKKERVILVDDVATSGNSLIESAQILKRKGLIIDSAIVVLDRQEGAKNNLKKEGIKLYSLFKAKEFR